MTTLLGFHPFPSGGSFEIFWDSEDLNPYDGQPRNFDSEGNPVAPGFYWWPCHPGCLPDGEPQGPFATAAEAWADARAEHS